jgi:hypothetical protein
MLPESFPRRRQSGHTRATKVTRTTINHLLQISSMTTWYDEADHVRGGAGSEEYRVNGR